MNLVISLAIAVAIAYYGKNIIRKKSTWCYLGTFLCTVGLIAYYQATVSGKGMYLNDSNIFLAPVYIGSLSTAFFIIVMYLGVLPKKHWAFKNFRGIRGQLSIIASIMILSHNCTMGAYVAPTIAEGGTMAIVFKVMAVTTKLMILLLLPLTITSFICIHKKMKEKNWKKLQGLAYPFYALIYIHVMLGNVPGAMDANIEDMIDVLVYNIIFIPYLILRVKKAKEDMAKKKSKVKK